MKRILIFAFLITSFIPAHAYAYGSKANVRYYLDKYTLCVQSNKNRMTHNPDPAHSVASRILNYCQPHLNGAIAEIPNQSKAKAANREIRAGFYSTLVKGIIRDRRGY